MSSLTLVFSPVSNIPITDPYPPPSAPLGIVPCVDTNDVYQYWRDTGCEVAPSCFACTLPDCKYDPSLKRLTDPEWASQKVTRRRAEVATMVDDGVADEEIAAAFGVGLETIKIDKRVLGCSAPAGRPRTRRRDTQRRS